MFQKFYLDKFYNNEKKANNKKSENNILGTLTNKSTSALQKPNKILSDKTNNLKIKNRSLDMNHMYNESLKWMKRKNSKIEILKKGNCLYKSE